MLVAGLYTLFCIAWGLYPLAWDPQVCKNTKNSKPIPSPPSWEIFFMALKMTDKLVPDVMPIYCF